MAYNTLYYVLATLLTLAILAWTFQSAFSDARTLTLERAATEREEREKAQSSSSSDEQSLGDSHAVQNTMQGPSSRSLQVEAGGAGAARNAMQGSSTRSMQAATHGKAVTGKGGSRKAMIGASTKTSPVKLGLPDRQGSACVPSSQSLTSLGPRPQSQTLTPPPLAAAGTDPTMASLLIVADPAASLRLHPGTDEGSTAQTSSMMRAPSFVAAAQPPTLEEESSEGPAAVTGDVSVGAYPRPPHSPALPPPSPLSGPCEEADSNGKMQACPVQGEAPGVDSRPQDNSHPEGNSMLGAVRISMAHVECAAPPAASRTSAAPGLEVPNTPQTAATAAVAATGALAVAAAATEHSPLEASQSLPPSLTPFSNHILTALPPPPVSNPLFESRIESHAGSKTPAAACSMKKGALVTAEEACVDMPRTSKGRESEVGRESYHQLPLHDHTRRLGVFSDHRDAVIDDSTRAAVVVNRIFVSYLQVCGGKSVQAKH